MNIAEGPELLTGMIPLSRQQQQLRRCGQASRAVTGEHSHSRAQQAKRTRAFF
jgi:hypothetical protein